MGAQSEAIFDLQNVITVFKPGSSVLVGDDIEATITSVSLDCGGRVAYRCAWWDGRVLRQEWLEACMVRPSKRMTPLATLGFVAPVEGKP